MWVLYRYDHFNEETKEVDLILCSNDRGKLENKINELVEPYEKFIKDENDTVIKNKEIMRVYLNANRDAIDGFLHKGNLSENEKDNVINFLCKNYSYSFGKFDNSNSFIIQYCDINKLSKPYPKLILHKTYSDRYKDIYIREYLNIKEVKYE